MDAHRTWAKGTNLYLPGVSGGSYPSHAPIDETAGSSRLFGGGPAQPARPSAAATPIRPGSGPRAGMPGNGAGPVFRRALQVSGGVLLSHAVAHAVPSALEGLTSGFGMGPGGSPPL